MITAVTRFDGWDFGQNPSFYLVSTLNPKVAQQVFESSSSLLEGSVSGNYIIEFLELALS